MADARVRTDHLRRQAGERLEQERDRRSSVRVALDFYERDRTFAGGLLAGGLAFRLFLWLLPLVLVVVTALGLVSDLSEKSPAELARQSGLSGALAGTVAQAVEASGRGRIFLLLLGLWLLVWAGMGVVKALRLVYGLAWGIPAGPRAHSIRGSALFTGFVLVIIGAQFTVSPLYGGGLVTDLLVTTGLAGVVVAATCWASWMLPHPQVPWTAVLPGALLLGVGFEVLRIVTAVYLTGRLERVADLYGALGFSAVSLLWLFLLGWLIVANASLNATLWDARHPSHGAPTPADRVG